MKVERVHDLDLDLDLGESALPFAGVIGSENEACRPN